MKINIHRSRRPTIRGYFRSRSGLAAKVAVVCIAVAIGVILLVICAYVILPGIISNTNDQIENNLALDLYKKTFVPDLSGSDKAAFQQPGGDTGALRFPRDGFSSVLRQNSDIVGRITIDALGITYLVTQSDDNITYKSLGYDRKENKSGAIYLDYRCNIETAPLSGHYIVYGSNINNGMMFHKLLEYRNADIFYGNRIFRFDTLYEDYEWEVFSAYETDVRSGYADTVFRDGADWLFYLRGIQQMSTYKTDAQLREDDVVLTLSTYIGEPDGKRFVVHARLLR